MTGYSDNYADLIRKIDGFIRKYYLNRVIKGSIILAASLFAAYVFFSLAEYYGRFDPIIRTFFFYSFVLGNLFILLVYITIPLLRYFRLGKTISHEQASAIIGQHFYPIKDKLLNTLQLKRLSDLNPGQRLLINASIDQKVADMRSVPFTSAVHIRDNRKYLKYALLPMGLIITIFFAAPSVLKESSERLINYNKRFVKKAPFRFEVLNDSLAAVQGDNYTLQVKLSGNEIPAEIYLEDGANNFRLERENTIRFNYTFKNLQKTKRIRLRAGEFSSKDYTIRVNDRPVLMSFDVLLEYPAYLNKTNESFRNSGDLTVPEGTRVHWKFHTRSSERVGVMMDKRLFTVKPAEKGIFKFSFRAMKSLNYQIQPRNSQVPAVDSVSYQLRVIPDLLPTVDLTERRDSANNKVIYFVGQVNDDHGFSNLKFNYTVLNDSTENKAKSESVSVSFDKNALQSNFFYVWNINEIKARPGDQIEYYFEIYDNDGVNGPKPSRSAIRTLRLATDREIDNKLEENSGQIKQKLGEAIRKASQVEKEAKKFNQDLLNKNSLSYEDKKQLENLLQQQQEIEQLVNEIRKENKQNLFERKESREQSAEILEKQQQIEDLFNNALDEKTREILKNIQQLLEKNSPKLTQDELSKMQLDNRSLRKELDRILELYKQLEFDQNLAGAINELNRLAHQQEELSRNTLDGQTDKEKLELDQNGLRDNFKKLKAELRELEQKNEALENKNNFDNPEKEQAEIEQQQQQSSENLKKNEQKKAAQNQELAAQKMQKLAQKLENMQSEGEEQESDVNIKSLREILDNLITSSFDQEKTMQSIRTISNSDPAFILHTQKQKEIQDNMKMIEDSLYALSKKVPQIQAVVNKEIQTINFNINEALGNLAERRVAEASRNQQFSMTSINNLALMLNEALVNLQRQQNGKPGGKAKKQTLSQLSKMQEQLNKNMQKARQQMQQEGQQNAGQQRQQMSEQLVRMAREQQMIRQAIQEINRLENKDGKGSLGNLNELMKEMEQTETDLVNRRIQQETLFRQQQILSKLIEADKAERERETEEKRESREAISPAPNYDIILQEYQKIKKRETDLLKTVPPTLNSFYKIKVGDYFKYLNSDDND